MGYQDDQENQAKIKVPNREINVKRTSNDNKRYEMPSKKVELERDRKNRMQNSHPYEIHKRRESTEQTEISKQAKSQRPYCICNSDCGLTLRGRDMDGEDKRNSMNYSYTNQSEFSVPQMKVSNPPAPNPFAYRSKEKYDETVNFPSQKKNGREVKMYNGNKERQRVIEKFSSTDFKSLQMDRSRSFKKEPRPYAEKNRQPYKQPSICSCSSTEIMAEKGFGNRKKATSHVNRPKKVNTAEDSVYNIRQQQRSKKNSITPLKFNYGDLTSYDTFQEQCSDKSQVLYECDSNEKAVEKFPTIYSSECENRKKVKLQSCQQGTNKFFQMFK